MTSILHLRRSEFCIKIFTTPFPFSYGSLTEIRFSFLSEETLHPFHTSNTTPYVPFPNEVRYWKRDEHLFVQYQTDICTYYHHRPEKTWLTLSVWSSLFIPVQTLQFPLCFRLFFVSLVVSPLFLVLPFGCGLFGLHGKESQVVI